MRAFSAADLLTIWERGAGGPPIEQALAILSVALPQVSKDALAGLNILQRDLCLLNLRRLTFGSQIKGLADCPACDQRLEFDFSLDDLPASDSPLPDPETMNLLPADTSFRMDGYTVTYRLPSSADLLTVSQVNVAGTRHRQMVERCVVSIQRDDRALDVSELSPDTLNAIVERMSQDNPLADLTLPTTCRACGHTWEIIFDIASYFWGEINAWALRLMREVHILATTYGWREADILAMSAWRRQRYLEMIGV